MKTRILLILVVSLFLSEIVSAQQTFGKVSKVIAGKAQDRKGNLKRHKFSEIRNKLLKVSDSPLLHRSFRNDTLFVLETFSLEDQTYWGRIWDRAAIIEYSFQQNKFTFLKIESIFDSSVIKCIQNWDTLTIRKDAEKFGPTIPAAGVYCTRVIVTESTKMRVDTFSYEYFIRER